MIYTTTPDPGSHQRDIPHIDAIPNLTLKMSSLRVAVSETFFSFMHWCILRYIGIKEEKDFDEAVFMKTVSHPRKGLGNRE